MNTNTREVPAPESYATFWAVPPSAVAAPLTHPVRSPADVKDAYLEFVNVTEAEAIAPRTERAA